MAVREQQRVLRHVGGCVIVTPAIATLPFALPIIVYFGYDPVWWAIINVIIVELGLVIPPIGLVILIINAMRPDIPLRTLYRSIVPFVVADLAVLALRERALQALGAAP